MKILIYSCSIIGAIGILISYVDMAINFDKISVFGIIGIVFLGISEFIIKRFQRGEKIKKLFENATEKEKEEIYNFVKQYDKK